MTFHAKTYTGKLCSTVGGVLALSSFMFINGIQASSLDEVRSGIGFPERFPDYYYFGFNDNNHFFQQSVYTTGSIYYEYIRFPNDRTDLFNKCTSPSFDIPFGVTNNNTAIGYKRFTSATEFGYIMTFNIDTNECTSMEVGASFRPKGFNDLAEVLHEADGMLFRYTPTTGEHVVVPIPTSGVTEAQINDAGYIVYSINSTQSYVIRPNDPHSYAIPEIGSVMDINDNNFIIGGSVNGCYTYHLDTQVLNQIDSIPCTEMTTLINDNDIALIERPDDLSIVYRVASDETFVLKQLPDFVNLNGELEGLNNHNTLFVVYNNGEYWSRSIHSLELPTMPLDIDNDSPHFLASSRWVPILNGKYSYYVPIAVDEWRVEQSKSGHFGKDYLSIASGSGSQKVSWTQLIETAGVVTVKVRYPEGIDNNTQAHYKVNTSSETSQVIVNQQLSAGQWVTLGSYYIEANSTIIVELSDAGNGVTVADAVRLQTN